jgi:Mn-containing catalase
MSQGDGADGHGPWNTGGHWKVIKDRDKQAAVDGGDGSATVKLSKNEKDILVQAVTRTASHPDSNPTTGADLGAGPGAGATKKTPKK